jgi:hypothetical protein
MFNSSLDVKEIFSFMEQRNSIFNRNLAQIERCYAELNPEHRESFNYFRKFGLILPMSSTNAQLNTPNDFLLHPELGWVLDHDNNPLYGWPMKKVLSTNPYNVPKNDLYGRLYFYLVDKMKLFVKAI